MSIAASLPQHQVAFYHVPNRPLSSVTIMTIGPLAVVPIGSFNMVSSAGTVPVIQIDDPRMLKMEITVISKKAQEKEHNE